ncbi:MAG TPA: P-type conjugative transfer protein TrbL, partial [Sphingopyxis sp.]|nr:P-type conjugative transfer protein TrbL [Sphingopyxis sp.]
AARGRDAAWNAGTTRSGGGQGASSTAAPAGPAPTAGTPAWASAMKADQRRRSARQAAIHTLSSGDRGGSGANPEISEKED